MCNPCKLVLVNCLGTLKGGEGTSNEPKSSVCCKENLVTNALNLARSSQLTMYALEKCGVCFKRVGCDIPIKGALCHCPIHAVICIVTAIWES